jgi:acid phosphatase (class A)
MTMLTQFKTCFVLGIVTVCLASLGGCATPKAAPAAVVTATSTTPPPSRLDWAVILPQGPQQGSLGDRYDMEVVRSYQTLKDSPRWIQARGDASTNMMAIYGPIIGPDFTPEARPEVVALLAYAARKLSEASTEAKSTFPRPRPFLADPNLQICTDSPPAGSGFPSGHAGWGWLSAQILARVEPHQAQALLARGRDYGTSRVVCAVHYPSDVEAGRLMGDGVLARLDIDPRYQELLAAAKLTGK